MRPFERPEGKRRGLKAGILSSVALLLVLSFSLLPEIFADSRSLKGNPEAPLPQDPALVSGRLPGGLSYYVRPTGIPDDRILFRLVVAAGALDEKEKEAGYAHFVEHMAFNGTDMYPGNALDDLMASLDGGMDLEMNAFTYPEYTVYLLEIPADREDALDLGVGILRQWEFALRFDTEEVAREKGVIRAEAREYDTPEERQRQREDATLYGEPLFEWGILGTPDSLYSAIPEGLRAFYRRCYIPERMAVVVTGPFDTEKARSALEKTFSDKDNLRSTRGRSPTTFEGKIDGMRVVRGTDDRRGRVELRLLFREPAEPLSSASAFLREYRADATSVVLADRLADEGAAGDGSWIFLDADRWAERCGERLWEIVVSCPPGEETAALRDVGRTIAALKAEGASVVEAETACREASQSLPSEDPDGYEIADSAERSFLYGDVVPDVDTAKELEPWLRRSVLGNGSAALGTASEDLPSLDAGVLSIVSPTSVPLNDEDLLDAFRKGLKDTNPSRGAAGAGHGISSGETKGNRFPEATLGENLSSVKSRSVREDGAVELILSNGLRVSLKATDSGGGWAYLGAWSPGGLAAVPEGARAVADEAPEILRAAGYPAASPIGLREELSGTSVAWTTDVEAGCEWVEADASSDDLEPLFRLAAALFSPPVVSARSVRNAVLIRQEELRLGDGPEADFHASVDSALNLGLGRIRAEDLEGLSPDQVVSAWAGRFGDASDFVFAAAGDFDLREAERLAVSVLGRIPVRGGREPSPEPAAFPKSGMKLVRADGGARRGGVAAIWRLDGVPARDASDLDALARGLESRLFRKLREELSSTYDVVCRWYPSPEDSGAGEFLVEFGSSPEDARALSGELFREIRAASSGENPDGWSVEKERTERPCPDDETVFLRLLAEARGAPLPPEPRTEPGAVRLTELASRWLAPEAAAVFVLGY